MNFPTSPEHNSFNPRISYTRKDNIIIFYYYYVLIYLQSHYFLFTYLFIYLFSINFILYRQFAFILFPCYLVHIPIFLKFFILPQKMVLCWNLGSSLYC